MRLRRLAIVITGIVLPALGAARAEAQGGRYARIAILQPHEGHTVDFEAGYVRHLEWHRQARDGWVWYGWTVTFGERQRSFVYASLTVDLVAGAEEAFEAALRPGPSSPLEEETLWYRMLAGGPLPRYVRLRPRATLQAVVEGKVGQALPAPALLLVARMTVEVLTLRPAMSLGLAPARP